VGGLGKGVRILVTGGTGLFGSNVIKVDHEKCGSEVVITLCKRMPEVPWDVPQRRLPREAGSAAKPGVAQVDLGDAASVRTAVEDYLRQAVIHCAALSAATRNALKPTTCGAGARWHPVLGPWRTPAAMWVSNWFLSPETWYLGEEQSRRTPRRARPAWHLISEP
jgi:hypothetical protein